MPQMLTLSLTLAAAVLVGTACTKPTAPTTSESTPPAEQPAVNRPTANTNTTVTKPAPAATPTPAPTQPPATQTVTITMNNGGFSPSEIIVARGGKVMFVNRGTRSMWPASDPHPAHTGLAGFDPKHGVAPTESWSFTFTKAGRFTYHDHLNPFLAGTVIVQ